jgi:hypothetical protein
MQAMRSIAALPWPVLFGMMASALRAESPAPITRPSPNDGLPELRADVFRLDRVENHLSQSDGSIAIWVFRFRHHEAKALSFYGYSNEDGDFFSGYGDMAGFDLGTMNLSMRRYYSYELLGPKGWRQTNPWQFMMVGSYPVPRYTPREFTIEPGVETELRFNIGHGDFDRRPSKKKDLRIGIFAPDGDFWSDPIKVPGNVVPKITQEMLNEKRHEVIAQQPQQTDPVLEVVDSSITVKILGYGGGEQP